MKSEEIYELLIKKFPEGKIEISGEGCKFTITIIDSLFEGKSLLKRHQLVNELFINYFKDGTMHAITIVAKTPEELRRG